MEWCNEGGDCKRQTTDTWYRALTDPETHFPFDDQEDDLSASTCTVWRGAKTGNNFMEIKLGVQHKVMTGYKVYTTGTGVTNGEVQYSSK